MPTSHGYMFNGTLLISFSKNFRKIHFQKVMVLKGLNLKIFMPRSILGVRKRFFSVRIINEWNNLSEITVKSDTLEKFKFLLVEELGDKLFHFYD